MFYAQEAAQKYGEGYVSTEHMLLGLLREENCAMKILERMGIEPRKVITEVEKNLPVGDAKQITDMSLTPRSKRAIDLAYDEARNFGHNYIGTEHLLLGLIREEGGLAGRVLMKLGASLEKTRRAALDLFEEDGGNVNAPPKYEPASQQTARQSVRIAYAQPILAREASFTNLLFSIEPLRFTEEILLALCLSDKSVRFALMKQNIEVDTVRAVMQAVLADPDDSRIQAPVSLSNILEFADKERSSLGDEELGAIHILIAIMSLDTSLAALALFEAGVNLEALRERKREEP